jgi:hypothetical protein
LITLLSTGTRSPGGEKDPHARLDLLDRKVVALAPPACSTVGATGRKRARPDRDARALAHDVVERTADQQKEQQRHRGVEIGVRAAVGVS